MTALTEQQLDDALNRLPESIDPASNLWPGIEARMVSRSTQARTAHVPGIWRMAAAVTVVGAAALLAILVTRAPATGDFPVAHQTAAEIEYMQVREQLIVGFDERLAVLSPETREVVEQNLERIQQSIGEIADALDSNPNNTSLQRLLFATYQQELNLLGHINRVTGTEPTEGLEI